MSSKLPTLEQQAQYRKQLEGKREIRQLFEALAEFLHENRSCVTCEFFNQATELCSLAKQRPPATVIARGCEAWSPDIPF